MAKPTAYHPVFSGGAADFIIQLPKRKQAEVVRLAWKLAESPFVRSDYHIADDTGREIEHLLVEAYVFAYWLDHAVREVRITDIEDAS